MNVCILASSGGYTFDYLLSAINLGIVDCSINKIITDRSCRTDSIAKKHGIRHSTISQDMSLGKAAYSNLLLRQIPESTDLVLISLRRLIGGDILREFPNRIVNTHPSLLPAYQGYGANKKLLNDGKAMFGGCSCHLVNELPDDGPIIIQSVVPLDEINEQKEWELKLWHHQKYNLAQAVQFFSENRVRVNKNSVFVKDAKYNSLPTNPAIELSFDTLDSIFELV
tara:strand:+ start:2607 stop:3281 length:675 start_codon:yes stop_codon:yes gene_type:complete